MPAIAPTPVEDLPPGPAPSDSPAAFDAKAYTYVAALPAFIDQLNDLGGNAYGNAQEAASQAAAAGDQVAAATEQVGLATEQVALAAGHATTAEGHKNQAGTYAAAAAIAAGAAIPAGSGQLLKTEGAANVKTANFTWATGRVYDCDTSAGAFTVAMPGTLTTGDWFGVTDHKGTFDLNPLTIAHGSNLIEFAVEDFICDLAHATHFFVWVGGTKGLAAK